MMCPWVGHDHRSAVADPLICRGGAGTPVVLVHGLMGRGTTWSRQLPWLTRLGEVFTYDAPWHRGREVDDAFPISTERFVADLADAVAALGAPGAAGRAFDGRTALVVSGCGPPRVGRRPRRRGHGTRLPRPDHGPVGAVVARVARRVRDCATGLRRVRAGGGSVLPRGVRPHSDGVAAARRPERWIEIAAEWGTRDYWGQWHAVSGADPADRGRELGHPARPDGKMAETGARATYLHVPGAGHLVHDDAPGKYQDAVQAFLSTFTRGG